MDDETAECGQDGEDDESSTSTESSEESSGYDDEDDPEKEPKQRPRARYSELKKRKSICDSLGADLTNQRRLARSSTQLSNTVDILQKKKQDQLAAQSSTCSGILVDFINRIAGLNTSTNIMRPTKSRATTISEALLEPHSQLKFQGMFFATQRISQEVLLNNIMEELTNWGKSTGAAGWELRKKAFTKIASKMVKNNVEAKCLRNEVKSWVFRHRILHCRPLDCESATEKHTRKQQFWAELHEGSRKVELKAVRPPFKDNLRERIHGTGVVDTNSKRIRRLSTFGRDASPMGTPKIAHATRRGEYLLHDVDWKRQSSRSKVSAGNWDWKHNSAALPRSPQHAKPKNRLPTRHWSSSLLNMTDQEFQDFAETAEDEEERLHDGAGETFFTRNPPILRKMGRPASAPNLKELGAVIGLQNLPGAERSSKKNMKHSRHPHVGSAVLPPWQGSCADPILRCRDTPAKQYIRACSHGKNIPRCLPFLTEHSLKLKAGGQVLSDDDLLELTVALDEVCLTEVDLNGNTALTQKSLLPLVRALSQPPISESLQNLCLKRCAHASTHPMMSSIIDMISSPGGTCNLLHLDLTDVVMSINSHLPFARAVKNHACLQTLHMCNTGIGTGDLDVRQLFHDLLGSETIEVLDLGWNCFSSEVFSLIGERHVEVQRLRKLGLSNCISSPLPGRAANIVYFLEHLSGDKKLRSLDVSSNTIDFRGALVLEDALMNCKNLTELNISENPLGVIGMRSLLRLISRDSSGLCHFDCSACTAGVTKHATELQMFSATDPAGRYKFELDRPYHRALLRMLYKTCERFSLHPADAFFDIRHTGGGAWEHAQKDDTGTWVVPKHGNLNITFSIDRALQNEMRGIHDNEFGKYLMRHYKLMRCAPSFRKVVPLFAQWKSFDGCTTDQQVMLDAMAKDFLFTYPHIKQLCETDYLVNHIIQKLFCCIEGGPRSQFLVLSLSKKDLALFVPTLKQVHCLLTFNVENPNGHYSLNLEHHPDHALAEKLLLLDRWESGISKRRGLKDVSQRGNYSTIRNERYQHHPIKVRTMSDWHLPEHDLLEFDYSSCRRPSVKTLPVNSITHSNIMVTLQESTCAPEYTVKALRSVSHLMPLTSKQLRAIFGLFKEEELFAELLVMFFVQIVDLQNGKIFRVRIENQKLSLHVQNRLGYISTFPFIQPEQSHFVFDFAYWDQRVAANMLLILAEKEDLFNLHDPSFVHANGTVDPLYTGIPRSWEYLEKIPKSGVLSLTYYCSPESRNFAHRKRLYEAYSFRSLPQGEADVLWWSSLRDAPEDVLTYLHFLSAHFNTMHKAFLGITHNHEDAVITLREFEDSVFRMGCKKFRGPREAERGHHEMERIRTVFRSLDPSGEGQVSYDEFMLLEQMFREILLSISEFVEFCIRTFGDNLEEAWVYLDEDESGEIDESEWAHACGNAGYHGPVDVIFRYLDRDDEGTVSFDEFQELEKFKNPTSPKS